MDGLTFIAEVVKALAWPVAAVVLGLLFRGEIRALLAKLKKGKVGPAEFEFEQAVAALKQEVPTPSSSPVPALSSASIELARSEPRAAILNAWLEVQAETERLVAGSPEIVARSDSGSVTLRVLHHWLKTRPEYIDMYNELKHLRNQAINEVAFNPRLDSVLNYIELSKRLVEVLGSLKPGVQQ